jgi:heptosyltransferase-2
MSQVLYSHLRSNNQDRVIDVLLPRSTLPLVSRMPEVNRGILFDVGHGQLKLGYRQALGSKLRANNYAQVIVLPNSFKSALLPLFAGIPLRTGFLGEYRYFLLNDIRLLNKQQLPRMVDRFIALAVSRDESLPEVTLPRLLVDRANQQAQLESHRIALNRPLLGLCPGAEFGDSKRWPVRHYSAVAEYAAQKGMQVLILGGPGDCHVGQEIRERMSPANRRLCIDVTGKTSLPDVIDLIDRCQLVVSNDSGLMHIAAAVGRPMAVLYGSTSPAFTPPLSIDAAIISAELDCSPCFKRTCPFGHTDCLNKLSPDRLYDLVDRHADVSVDP